MKAAAWVEKFFDDRRFNRNSTELSGIARLVKTSGLSRSASKRSWDSWSVLWIMDRGRGLPPEAFWSYCEDNWDETHR